MEKKEKKEKRRISVISISVIVILVIAVACVCLKFFVFDKIKSNNDMTGTNQLTSILGEDYIEYDGETKINTSEYLQEDKYLDNFVFNNFDVYCIDGVTRIEFDVFNDSENRENLDSFKFIVASKENVAGEIKCQGSEFAAKQTKRLSVVVNCDVSNMFDIYVDPIYSNVM